MVNVVNIKAFVSNFKLTVFVRLSIDVYCYQIITQPKQVGKNVLYFLLDTTLKYNVI